jgi:hypothetical protein
MAVHVGPTSKYSAGEVDDPPPRKPTDEIGQETVRVRKRAYISFKALNPGCYND